MSKDQLKYLALWLFLAGVILIVFLQFIAGENINRLIQGNRHLLNEVRLQNELRQLEADVLTVQSDIRGAVITNNTAYLPAVQEKINNIERRLPTLKKNLHNPASPKEIADLDLLIREKIALSRSILNAFEAGGKEAAEKVVNASQGQQIRDSVIRILSRIDQKRQTELSGIIGAIEYNGKRARTRGFTLAAIACVICVLAFLYVVNIGRQQNRIIAVMNESEKRIKEAAVMKEQFLANMSHEIRTPLNAILGFTNLLKKTELKEAQKNYVEFIQSSGENLLTLINDILDLSKIEAGMMSIEAAPFSLNGLISSVEIMFREKAKAKGLEFKVFIEPGIHDTLNGDSVRLTQILINLLSNAVKFTDTGFVHLNVRLVKQSAEEVELAFCVEDTGVGIAPEKRQHIFERFQQAEAEITRRYGGTGLGLSIVKQLVDLQQGIIQVRSEVGKGSEFIVILPFTPAHEAAVTRSRSIQPEEMRRAVSGIAILVAEDNLMNQQLINHLMEQWGAKHTLVNNGKEALEALKKQPFALVLMDIQMPEMDGYTTALAIRNELKSNVPIVAMTAHAMPGEKEKCLSYGMNEYISKPIKEAELYGIIERYAQKGEAAGTNANEPLVDLTYLKELSLGDAEFENAIIRQFVVQVPEEWALLQEAVQKLNFQQIKSVAHSMKSSVAYMGLADKLHPVLQRMEAAAAAAEAQHPFADDYREVKAVCERAVDEARQLLAVVA